MAPGGEGSGREGDRAESGGGGQEPREDSRATGDGENPLWSEVATIQRGTRPRSLRTMSRAPSPRLVASTERGGGGGRRGRFAKSVRDADGGCCSGGFTCIGPGKGSLHSSY